MITQRLTPAERANEIGQWFEEQIERDKLQREALADGRFIDWRVTDNANAIGEWFEAEIEKAEMRTLCIKTTQPNDESIKQ